MLGHDAGRRIRGDARRAVQDAGSCKRAQAPADTRRPPPIPRCCSETNWRMRSPAAQTDPRRSLREEGRAEETNPSARQNRLSASVAAQSRSRNGGRSSRRQRAVSRSSTGTRCCCRRAMISRKIGAVIIRRSSIPRRVHLLCRMNCRCDAPPDRDVVRELCTSNGIVKSIDSYSGTPTHPQYQVAPPPRAGRFARKARVASVSEARHGGHPDGATRRPVIAGQCSPGASCPLRATYSR